MKFASLTSWCSAVARRLRKERNKHRICLGIAYVQGSQITQTTADNDTFEWVNEDSIRERPHRSSQIHSNVSIVVCGPVCDRIRGLREPHGYLRVVLRALVGKTSSCGSHGYGLNGIGMRKP